MDVTVFKNYSSALFEIAVDKKKVDEFKDDMSFIKKIIDENNDFIKFLDTPFIENIHKNKVIDEIFKSSINKDVLNFFKILVSANLAKYFNEIYLEYSHLTNVYNGVVEGIIYSAFELKPKQIEKITEVFSDKIQKKVSFKVLIKEDLIGGIKILIQDKIYDYSVLNKINLIKENLLKN